MTDNEWLPGQERPAGSVPAEPPGTFTPDMHTVAAATDERYNKQMAVPFEVLFNELTDRLHHQDHRIAELMRRIAAVERTSA